MKQPKMVLSRSSIVVAAIFGTSQGAFSVQGSESAGQQIKAPLSDGRECYSQGGIVQDGTAYFTATDACHCAGVKGEQSSEFPRVVAFDVNTFETVRAYPFAKTYDSTPMVFRNAKGDWVILAHEHLMSRTVAMNRGTAQTLWISEPNQPGALFFGYSYYQCPDGTKLILMACQNGLHAMSGETGKDVWWVKRRSNGGVTPCVDQDNGWIFYQCNGQVLKVRAADGEILESVSVASPTKCVSWNTLLVNDSHGYFVATYWYGAKEWDAAIRVFDKDLNPVWEKTGLPIGKKATLTYAEGKLVSGSGNQWHAEYKGDGWKYIAAYAIASGEVAWKCDLSKYAYICILNVPYYNGFFYAETQDGKSVTSKVFRINASDGKLEEVLDYGRAITSCATSIIARGKIFSGDLHEGRIVVTEIAEESNLDWPGPFGDPQTNQMALSREPGAKMVSMREIVRPAAAEKPKTTRYLGPVLGCLDTLIRDGTDKYGKEHSPQFSSILDLKTHRMPKKPPSLLPLQRKWDRAYPGGNLQHDLFTLLAMYHLSKTTGEERYASAADAYLEFFLRRCASVGNGLFPCGEHAFWDFKEEKVGGLPTQENLALVPSEFWKHLWRINPEATERHIRGLRHHFLPGNKVIWNRHASILTEKLPTRPAPFPRHGGFYIYEWAFLHSKKPDPVLLKWAKETAEANKPAGNMSVISLGLSLLRANEMLGKDAIDEFDTLGRECLGPVIKQYPVDRKNAVIKIFVPHNEEFQPGRTYGFWDKIYEPSGGYAFVGAEKLALMCLCAYRLTDSTEHLQYAKDVWDTYQTLERPTDKAITPGKYGGLIALSLDLYDIMGQKKYLEYAKRNADWAVDELYENGLFRAGTGRDYYEAANGVGSLLIELLRLHLILTDDDYPLPRYYAET